MGVLASYLQRHEASTPRRRESDNFNQKRFRSGLVYHLQHMLLANKTFSFFSRLTEGIHFSEKKLGGGTDLRCVAYIEELRQ